MFPSKIKYGLLRIAVPYFWIRAWIPKTGCFDYRLYLDNTKDAGCFDYISQPLRIDNQEKNFILGYFSHNVYYFSNFSTCFSLVFMRSFFKANHYGKMVSKTAGADLDIN